MNIIIYGKNQCPHTKLAIGLCVQNNIPYEYLIVGDDITKDELRQICPVPINSVPQIFTTEGIYVGGVNELKNELHNHI